MRLAYRSGDNGQRPNPRLINGFRRHQGSKGPRVSVPGALTAESRGGRQQSTLDAENAGGPGVGVPGGTTESLPLGQSAVQSTTSRLSLFELPRGFNGWCPIIETRRRGLRVLVCSGHDFTDARFIHAELDQLHAQTHPLLRC